MSESAATAPVSTAAATAPASATESAAPRGALSRLHTVMIWLPLAMVALGVVGAWHFVSFAFVSNPVLNGTILAVAIWGATAMVMHVRVAYHEDRVFHAGLDWLRKGAWSHEPHPSLGPKAQVLGLLERLEKLGLGHEVSAQSAAMEPEFSALEAYFHKRQELSNFLVGLMVGLGLLGTFIGLLETLIATSEVIGSIANALQGGGNMDTEFVKIIGGLQRPLAAMGTAFSASMFGLVGSITLGFQAVVVRKTVASLVDNIREEVLSLAEKADKAPKVEITERYLSTLLGDLLVQQKRTESHLASITGQLCDLVPAVRNAALSSDQLAQAVSGHTEALALTTAAVGQVRDMVPVIGELAGATRENLQHSVDTQRSVAAIVRHLPEQAEMGAQLRRTLEVMDALSREVAAAHEATVELNAEVVAHSQVLKHLDAAGWSAEKASMRRVLEGSTS